jgi:hypothetical protein
MNYNPSTIARIADIKNGIRVDTGALLGTTYIEHSVTPQHELYTLKGRVWLHNLFFEVITADISTTAATLVWNATFSSTAYTVQPIGTKCTTISGLKVGHRIVWGGGILATAATLTTKPYLSDFASVTPMLLGGIDAVGTIGMLCEAATATTGSLKCSLFYTPASDGAYIEALV